MTAIETVRPPQTSPAVREAVATRAFKVLVAAVVAGAASVAALAAMPYSTSRIVRVDPDEARRPPMPGQPQSVGPLWWDYQVVQQSPALEPFRSEFQARCGGTAGLAAAECFSHAIAEKSRQGSPRTEFVDASYQPVAELRSQLGGHPGHCMSRSALTVTALLASGIPARIVQMLPRSSPDGHNVIEVYDPALGWVLYDGLYEATITSQGRPLSAVELTEATGALRWSPSRERAPAADLYAGATINFPEPWLYNRVGERCASWPFRGCFAQIGARQLRFGPAQQGAFGAGVLSGAVALGALVTLLRGRRSAS